MTYAGNFETLEEKDLVLSEASTVKLKLDRNKRTDSLKLHIREYVTTEEYTGFTRNGISLNVESVDQLESLKTLVDSFISDASKHVTVKEG